jgi:tetratricopeptide (TPR) repeat protein
MEGLALDDLFFSDIVASYRDVPRFLRREWLDEELTRHLADPATRFILLTAEPGAGKSAFVAQLADDHHDWPRFFIRRDQVSPVAESDARSFLLRIGFQLAATYPELFELEQVRIEVAQRIGTADPEADIVGAEISRIYASPFHRAMLRIRQDINQAGGSVAGVRVGEWITDPRLIPLADLQQMSLLDPARILRRLHPEARIVVLIDALDELRFRDQDGSLLDWLVNCPPLPDNVRMVLTSRPSLGQLAVFREKQRAYMATLAIDADDMRVQADIRSYAQTMIEPPAIATAVEDSGREEESFLAELVAKADGNIGYLAAIGRAFDQAAGAGERRGALDELLRLDRLPDGIQGLHAFFLRLIQTGPGSKDLKVTDPVSHRTGLVNAWEELFHPILKVLAVCLAPLTLAQIHVFTGTFADRAQLAGAVEWLDQFLDQLGDGYRLYHNSLAEFLVAAATRENAETAGFFVDAAAEHRRLAGLLEGHAGSAEIWQDVADPREQERRDYARRHYIEHLYLGGDTGRLTEVIDDGQYGRGKLRFDPSTALYAGDLGLAIRALTRDEVVPRELLDQLPRLWRYSMLRCSLTSNADNYPDSAYVALCLVGRNDEAQRLAELLSSPERQGLVFAAMGEALAPLPEERDRAKDLLLRSCAIVRTLRDEEERAFVMKRILDACRTAAVTGFRNPELAAAVYTLASWYYDNGGGFQPLATAIWYFDLSGAEPSNPWQHISVVDEMLAAARDRAQQPGPDPQGVSLLIAISRIELLLDRADDARGTLLSAASVARADDPERRIDGLVAVARELAALGDRDHALAIAGEARELNAAIEEVPQEPGDGIALSRMPGRELRIGEVLAEAGDWESALSISAGMSTGWANPALAAVRELCRRSEWDRATATAADMSARERRRLTSGYDIVEMHSHGELHSKPESAHLAIIESLAAAGQGERAAELTRGLTAAVQAEGLALVAAACARRALLDDAGRLLAEMRGVLHRDATQARRDRIWPPLMDLLAAADAFAEGPRTAALASSAGKRQECLERLATALAQRDRFDEALDVVASMDGWRVDAALAVQQHVPADGTEFPSVSGRVLDLIAADLAEGRSYETPDETALVAQPLIESANLRSRRGEHELAAQTLSRAIDALNNTRRFVYQPTPWYRVPAALARAGQLQAALRLMNQIKDPVDRTCGLAEFAKAADEDERPDVAYNMLADALETAANTDWMTLSLVLNRARGVAARVRLPDLLELLLANITSSAPGVRAEIATALAEQGAVGQALDILAALPDEQVSKPYAAVISAMLGQGDLGAAEGLLPKVDAGDRIDLCTKVASALATAGRTADAVRELVSGGERWEGTSRWWLDSELRDIAAALRETADASTSVLHVANRWKRPITWEQLAMSFCWAHAVITQRPDSATEIAAGFDWVESAIAADAGNAGNASPG